MADISGDLERLGRLLDEGKLTREEFETAKAALLQGQVSTPETKAPPGWYNDPQGRVAHQAYWDGEKWTRQTRQTPKPASAKPKKSGLPEWVKALGGIGIVLLVLAYCGNVFGGGDPISDFPDLGGLDSPSASCRQAVTYRATGTASSVSPTLTNSEGNTEQHDSRALPWTESATFDCGEFVYVSAQNKGESGSVKCEIKAGTTTIETAESTGAYVIASCSGSVPG